jgi:parvulin-like peptidyl-prolyl isomerase
MKLKKIFIFLFLFFLPASSYGNIDEGIAAVVNNEIIFLSELKTHIKKSGVLISNKEIQREYLKELTDLKLLELQGKRMGIVITKEQLDLIEKNFIETNTKEKVDSELARTGINIYRIRFGWKNQYLQENISTKILKSKVVISEEESEKYYLKNYGQFKKEKLVNLFLVVINDNEESKKKINNFKEIIKEKGWLASNTREYIKDGYLLPESKDLGYISLNDMNKEISAAVTNSSLNNLVGPFLEGKKLKYFYVKNKVVGDSEYLNLRNEIQQKLADSKDFEVLDGWFKDLRENAYISVRL